MKKHILMAAVAASMMLTGCGSGADDEAVTVTVTGSANARDAATAEGSSVLETLSAGTELTGRWVESDTNPSEQWFEYERDGEKAYVWGRNLSEQFKQEASLPRSDLITDRQPDVQEERYVTPATTQPLFSVGKYRYITSVNEGRSECPNGIICLNPAQYEAICKRASSVSSSMARSWYLFGYADDAIKELLKSRNNIESISTTWADTDIGLSSRGACKTYVYVSGLYKGTSTSGVAETWARDFNVYDDGDVVIDGGKISTVSF